MKSPGLNAEVLTQPPAYSFENCWNEWGDTLGLSYIVAEKMWNESQAMYTNEPPFAYHVKQHPLEVLWEAMRLCDYAESHGVAVNRRVLFGATLFHDAYYHLETPDRYDSKEAFSANIFELYAPAYGYSQAEIAQGKETIMATKLGVKPKTVEDKIIVRADIANVGGDYLREFMAKNRAFQVEQLGLGITKSAFMFAFNSVKVLSTYLSNDLSIGEFDTENGRCVFVNRAAENLFKYTVNLAAEQGQAVREFIRSMGSQAVNMLFLRNED